MLFARALCASACFSGLEFNAAPQRFALLPAVVVFSSEMEEIYVRLFNV